jgi:hypothetical protein
VALRFPSHAKERYPGSNARNALEFSSLFRALYPSRVNSVFQTTEPKNDEPRFNSPNPDSAFQPLPAPPPEVVQEIARIPNNSAIAYSHQKGLLHHVFVQGPTRPLHPASPDSGDAGAGAASARTRRRRGEGLITSSAPAGPAALGPLARLPTRTPGGGPASLPGRRRHGRGPHHTRVPRRHLQRNHPEAPRVGAGRQGGQPEAQDPGKDEAPIPFHMAFGKQQDCRVGRDARASTRSSGRPDGVSAGRTTAVDDQVGPDGPGIEASLPRPATSG